MEAMSITTIALGGAGAIGIITWLLTKIVGRSSGTKILDIFKKKVTEEREQKVIHKITKEQEVITKQIEIAETSSEITKQKVKVKIQEVCEEIQIILKEDKIAEIDKQIEEEWKDI